MTKNVLEIIEWIERATTGKKIEIIRSFPQYKSIWEYAYNPFKRYYYTPPNIKGSGNNIIDEETFYLLDKLHTRELSGNKAQEEIDLHISKLDYPNAEVFKRILMKDLRCGVSIKTINKAYPRLVQTTEDGVEHFPIMLVKTMKENKLEFPCLAAVKIDGNRGIFKHKHNNIYSRRRHIIKGCDHIIEELKQYNHDFDGELWLPGENFDESSGAIRSDNMTPDVVFYIFDCPSLEGDKEQRINKIEKFVLENDFIKVLPHEYIEDREQLNDFYMKALEHNYEGIVIYNINSEYKDGKSYEWMRMIPRKTADCPVIDFYEGEGRLQNTLGGIIINYKGVKVKVGTGFTDDLRSEIVNNKEHYLGAIAEVEFKEVTKTGSLRQPSFKRWRFDKS